jgi:hypothetical protein
MVFVSAVACSAALAAAAAPARKAAGSFAIDKTGEAVIVRAGDKEVLRYQIAPPRGTALPIETAGFFHPLATPAGVVATDLAPDDHKHHRGVFLAWVEMHGAKDADFWGWGKYAPTEGRRVVVRKVEGLAGGKTARFRAASEWRADDTVLLREALSAALRADGAAHVLDLTYAITPAADTRLSRWAFSGFCVRGRKDGDVESVADPDGAVDRPPPNHMKPETDWPAKAWYGYTTKLKDGATVALAVVDHPRNPPSLWHNALSIRMLNPVIVAPGEVTLKAGKALTLRYRVVVQDGPLDRALVERLAGEWARAK